MKKRKLVVGLSLILIAILILLDAIGILSPINAIIGEVSIISIILGIVLLTFCFICIAKISIPPVVIALSLLFMIFEKNIAFICGMSNENIINNWVLLIVAIVLAMGLKLIIPKKAIENYTRLGESTIYLDSKKAKHSVKNRFGECKIYFENTDEYVGNATLHVSNKFGETTIRVPSEWRVVSKAKSSFGEFNLPKHDTPANAPLLYIEGSNIFGELNVIYV